MGTIRQTLITLLQEQSWTAKEISRAVGVREKEVYDHLAHIARSSNIGGKLVITPSVCKACGQAFKKRDRLTPPSRCFRCKSESLTPPRFHIQPFAGPGKHRWVEDL